MARVFLRDNGTRLLNLHQMQTAHPQLCVVSSRHGGLQDKTAESFSWLRSLPMELRFFRHKAKGRANLMVVAVEENQVDAKLSNLTLDMAQAMTDVSAVSADVEILQRELSSVKIELTELAGIVQILRASGDRLDNHVSRYLESYEKYNEKNRMPYLYLILLVLVLDLILEVFLLMKFLKG